MEFNVKKRYGFTVGATVDNETIEDNVSEMVYGITDGKKDYSKRLGERIKIDFLRAIESLAYEVFSFDDQEFDSYDLMEVLFTKLPEGKKNKFVEWAKSQVEE